MSKDSMCNVPDEILEKLQKDISEIKVALIGNEYIPEGGLLCRMKDAETYQKEMEKKIIALEDKFNKIFWTAVGVSSTVTVIATLLFNLNDILGLVK